MEEDFSSVSWEREASSQLPQSSSPFAQGPAANADNDFEDQDLSDHSHAPVASSSKAPHANSVLDFGIYFHSTVNDPLKEQDGSQNAYVTYLVTTESNSPTFQSSTMRVRRRFSDFYFLYSMLYMEFAAVAVPPLPDKSRLEYVKGDRFGLDFTLKRANSLQRFLDRIAQHPILKQSSLYLNFLETTDWNAYKRSISARHQQVLQENGMLEGVTDTFLNAFAKMSQPDNEMQEVKERVNKLEENLAQVERVLSKVTRKQGDISNDFQEFSEQLLKLSALEKNLETEISSIANGTLNYSREIGSLREQIDGDYIISLRDMQNYVVAVKGLIKLREQKQLDYEALTDYLQRAKAEKDSITSGGASNFILNKIEDVRGINHAAARNERLHKVESKISALTEEISNVKQSSESFKEQALNEVDIFESIKRKEMKTALGSLADSHIAFYQNVIKHWEQILQ